uniref:Uncharacterized protein n=1 Tax=Haptolina brevifila TaxID=156173 RepID=A0A7S2C6B2_9EUKA|mmetsp:Transcript_20698/g.42072  ORF Transcript_20698/g.42072 Transcript_20698/m.42072 type:complete len:122 (+) Transcript_20698:622-987(+)
MRIFRAYRQPAEPQRRVHYFDVDAVWRRYPGVRCDGMHFASEFANFSAYGEQMKAGFSGEYAMVTWGSAEHARQGLKSNHKLDCSKSSAVYVIPLLHALEEAGLVQCVGRWSWRVDKKQVS